MLYIARYYYILLDVGILIYWNIAYLRYSNIEKLQNEDIATLRFWETKIMHGIFKKWNIEILEYLYIGILRYWDIETIEIYLILSY